MDVERESSVCFTQFSSVTGEPGRFRYESLVRIADQLPVRPPRFGRGDLSTRKTRHYAAIVEQLLVSSNMAPLGLI